MNPMSILRRSYFTFVLVTFMTFICTSVNAQTNTHYVSLTGTNVLPYTSWETAATNIQSAVDAADPGDLILVNDGTYTIAASISITKSITIRSVNGYSSTTVDGNHATRCLYMNNAGAVIDGFTIANGNNPSGFGGGVQNDNGTVQNCLIENNSARDGGGVALNNSGLVVNCIIRNNTADWGGGVRCFNGTVRGCLITENTATPHGGGVNIWSAGTIQNCTITNNTATDGSGIRLWNNGIVENSIIYFNNGSGNYVIDAGHGNSLSYCCTTPLYAGTGNLSDDPQFVNAGLDDYQLMETSTLVNAGLNEAWMTGAVDLNGNNRIYGTTVDIGVYEYTVTNYSIASSVVGAGGSIDPLGSVTVSPHGEQIFTITPDVGYHVNDVLVDGSSVGAVSSYTFSDVTADHTISASFSINTYTLTVTSVNGTVTKEPDQPNYSYGSIVQITAEPAGGYLFSNWSGDVSGSANPDTVTMDSDKNITANFAVDNNSHITIGSIATLSGSSITVPVSVHFGSGKSIPKYILQGKVIFDPEILKYRSNSVSTLFTSEGWTFTGYSTTAGQFDFIATGSNAISTDGILFNLSFDVISNITGSTQITSAPSYWLSNNSAVPALFSSIFPGTVSITSQSSSNVLGDVDGNFIVDYNDAIVIINHLVGIITLQGQSLINADVDHNGSVTLPDAIGVILYCTFGDWNYSLSLLSPVTSAYLSVDNPVINDNNVIIPLNIKNAENVRSLEVTFNYDPAQFDYNSFTAGTSSTGAITKASLVSPGHAKFVFASNELMNNDFNAGSVVLMQKNGMSSGGVIQTSYKINDGEEVEGNTINIGVTNVVNRKGSDIPTKFELVQNYPNPFNPTTLIEFGIPTDGYYSVRVYNIIGQTVKVLTERKFSPGNYKIQFDGNDLSSGIYFYRLYGSGVNLVRKMLLLK